MTRTEWARVRDLFERALELNPDDFQALLDTEAGDNTRVRAEVVSLLEHHKVAGAFLSEPAPMVPIQFDTSPLTPGRSIGPYTIVREAGHGGMGRVYVAVDQRLNRTVALKALRSKVMDSAKRDRLLTEARAAAALVHPGICTVYAFEELDNEWFIASEFIEGRTLRQEIAGDRRPSVEVVLRTATELASALAKAHDAGITHGDLKPDNVMRAYDGQLKILDFGLARIEAETAPGAPVAANPREGFLAGTPGYMAPELLNGRGRDPRSDVFSYGVLLYEHASGMHPFAAPSVVAMTTRVLESEATPLATLRPDLPTSLIDTIERCLRKSAAERYQSGGAVLRDLSPSTATLRESRPIRWWRVHQLVVTSLYLVASGVSWQIKELPAAATAATVLFLGIGVGATIAAVFRGHLLFTERVHGVGFSAERRRAAPVTLATDLAIGLALAIDGALLASDAPLAAVGTIGLGVSLALARLVLEPSTTAAAFQAEK